MAELANSPKYSMLITRGRVFLEILATVLLIAAASAVLWDKVGSRRIPPAAADIKVPSTAQLTAAMPTIGAALAKVVIIEYSDFQCPFCAKFVNETLPSLTSKYVKNGKVTLAFRHLPLVSVHPRALEAAVAATCAGQQQKFWEVHDRLFLTQPNAQQWNLPEMANAAGVNMAAWKNCVETTGKEGVGADLADAKTLGISTTPVFLLGVRQGRDSVKISSIIVGAKPARDFERVIEKLLKS